MNLGLLATFLGVIGCGCKVTKSREQNKIISSFFDYFGPTDSHFQQNTINVVCK